MSKVGGQKTISQVTRIVDTDVVAGRLATYSSTEGQATYPTATTDEIIGVFNESADSGASAVIVTDGIVYVYSAAAATYGEYGKVTGSAGQVTPATQATPSSTQVACIFEETTSDAGLVLANISCKGQVRTV